MLANTVWEFISLNFVFVPVILEHFLILHLHPFLNAYKALIFLSTRSVGIRNSWFLPDCFIPNSA